MVAGYVIGTVAEVVVLGPSVLAVFGPAATSTGASLGIDTSVCLVMLVIAVAGIRITAQTQISMALVEYAILVGFSIVGVLAVLMHQPGTFPVSKGWLSLSGMSGHGSPVAGLLISVYVYSAWDGTIYVNEEVKHRRVSPGRAALAAVALLTVIYTLAQAGLQGVVSPARLHAHASSALVYVAQALGGSGWAKVMALAIALSVIATTGTGIVLTARIVYGMASYRALPAFLGSVSHRFATPVAASITAGVLIVALTWVYMLATSVQNMFADVVAVAGLLFTAFYILTALATIAYYRRRIITSAWNLLALGILPLGAAGFLGWILVTSLESAPAGQVWSVAAILAAVSGSGASHKTASTAPWRCGRPSAGAGHRPGAATVAGVGRVVVTAGKLLFLIRGHSQGRDPARPARQRGHQPGRPRGGF
jgi:amino acid transporter